MDSLSGSLSVTTDTKGNVGIAVSGGVGGGSPSASVGVIQTATTAPDIYQQRGSSTQVGGSADIMGISIGIETSIFQNSDTLDTYYGGNLMAGIGAPIPAELHGEVAYSYVNGINIYDAMENIYITIMDW